MTARSRLIACAKLVTAQYRQYDGYWDNYRLARSSRSVKYKGGSQLFRGRVVLARPDMSSWFDPDTGHECNAPVGVLSPYPDY